MEKELKAIAKELRSIRILLEKFVKNEMEYTNYIKEVNEEPDVEITDENMNQYIL